MVDLRAIASEIGLSDPQTYLASGNLVARTALAPLDAAGRLEAALQDRLGLKVEIIARSASDYAAYLGDNPFADVSVAEPNRVLLMLANAKIPEDAPEALAALCTEGERVKAVRDGLWIHFAASVARSKLTPAAINRRFGAPATGRNWRTVQALAALARS
jgi:uncharacterized protein (DUF1697 family)